MRTIEELNRHLEAEIKRAFKAVYGREIVIVPQHPKNGGDPLWGIYGILRPGETRGPWVLVKVKDLYMTMDSPECLEAMLRFAEIALKDLELDNSSPIFNFQEEIKSLKPLIKEAKIMLKQNSGEDENENDC